MYTDSSAGWFRKMLLRGWDNEWKIVKRLYGYIAGWEERMV